MSVRSTIQGFYGGDAPMSLSHLLDRYRDEAREDALREAAEKIRRLAPCFGGAHHYDDGDCRKTWAAADLIDPDKENSADEAP
jgi:hypothetical protein